MNDRHVELRLHLAADGWLQGDLWLPAAPTACAVLFIHGFGSVRQGEKAQALRAACARRGWAFAAFDFRGHGASSGTLLDLRGSGLLADLDAIRAALARQGIATLLPVGSSMGGWAAAWYTLVNPGVVPACVVLAPAFFWLTNRWSKLTDAERRAWQETGKLRVKNAWVEGEIGWGLAAESPQYPWQRLAAEWQRPLLIFHGMADDVVPYSQSVYFTEQVRHPDVELRLFKDGDHRLTAQKDLIAEAACAFFARFV